MALKDKIRAARNGKGLTQKELADKMGTTRQTIINWEKGVFGPDVNEVKTLSEILDVDISKLTLNTDSEGTVQEPIPFYDATATAGLSLHQEDQQPIIRASETVNPGSWFRAATAAMRVYGDSMFPKYKSGCIIALKEILDRDEIVYGEDYVIETQEQRVLKRVMKSEKGEEYVEMNSINPQTDSRGKAIYAPKDFHLAKIRRVYKVLGQIQYEAGGDTMVHH